MNGSDVDITPTLEKLRKQRSAYLQWASELDGDRASPTPGDGVRVLGGARDAA